MTFNKMIAGALALVSTTSLAKTGEPQLQPQAWTEVTPVYVQGDIPEIQGIPVTSGFPASDYAPDSLSAGALSWLQHSETWGFYVVASVLGMLALLALFTLINGPVKLSQGFSGNKIQRWSKGDVAIHWLGGISCLVLIITGVIMAAGRFMLEPGMTDARWQSLIQGAVSWHNLLALPFIAGYLLMVIKWASKQMPEACDGRWFTSLGGYLNFGSFKGKHPDAGFANAGEKLWFWTFALFGLVVSVSGLLLMFPETFVTGKDTANWMLVGHLISAIVIGAFSMVHIFMATIISEGGMENMVSGYCDENWAKQHHNLWYKQIR